MQIEVGLVFPIEQSDPRAGNWTLGSAVEHPALNQLTECPGEPSDIKWKELPRVSSERIEVEAFKDMRCRQDTQIDHPASVFLCGGNYVGVQNAFVSQSPGVISKEN